MFINTILLKLCRFDLFFIQAILMFIIHVFEFDRNSFHWHMSDTSGQRDTEEYEDGDCVVRASVTFRSYIHARPCPYDIAEETKPAP